MNRKTGPSGKPMIHNIQHNTKKEAVQAAKRSGEGRPENHPRPKDGRPQHFHPTDGKGEIIKDGVHHRYPKNKV